MRLTDVMMEFFFQIERLPLLVPASAISKLGAMSASFVH